ncbi:hypothetical protein BVC80_8551g15 [Macleaya cordata]|uniref:MORF/ORRM1/DAG-like MORF domain-containing protein n=1 Tax=Macleaya cordata TaxID=56857 RepID=A0A200QV81_MACCD|nr:hypothetical protein BVC80_8551g15 [Macleaya cordata]
MAFSSLRLRRALTLSSSVLRTHRCFSAITSSSSSILQPQISSSSSVPLQNPRNHILIQSHSFRLSLPSLSSRSSYNNHDDKISEDTILFEGCDYNHWLITMDFPKDPKPTPEEMVETYVQTLAKVVGSVEEAKKRMYACSTTTYTGFQAVMTEEMSEKFRGLPGVVFILPDSYIDPINKEYGGDKYINGTIIPRPPPVQYGRTQGRYGDRNRNYDRPRYDRPMQQGNPPYDRQASMQGDGRNQPYDRPGFMQGDGRNQPYERQGYTQGDGRNQPYDRQASMQGDGRNYGGQQSYPPQPNYGPAGQGERRDSIPVGGRDYAPGGRENLPGERRDQMPPYSQGGQGNYPPPERRDFTQGAQRDYAPAEHRDFRGDNRNFSPPPSGGYGQGDASSFRQSYPGPGEGQSFQQGQQSDGMPMGQTWNEQDRFRYVVSLGEVNYYS